MFDQIAFIKLLDATGLSISKKYGADFGQQKMAGSLSMIIVPVFCGLLIDAISDKVGILQDCWPSISALTFAAFDMMSECISNKL